MPTRTITLAFAAMPDYRLVPIAFDVFHIKRNGVGVEFADRLRAAVNAFGFLIMFM